AESRFIRLNKLNKQTGARRPARRSAALRAQAREVYREAILAAAERVFARRGVADTRMSDVAAEVGVATGTLYNYFENRDTLLSSLMEERSDELIREVRAAADASTGASPRARLEALVRASFQHFESHRALFAVFLAAGGIAGRPMATIARRCSVAQRG